MNTLSVWLHDQWLRRGWAGWLLWPLQALYASLVSLRRQLYQQGMYASRQLPVPVVIVGNRIAGGAGKTPTVIALVQHLQKLGWTPGVLSRGYGRHIPHNETSITGLIVDNLHANNLNAIRVGDEPWLIWQRTHAPMAIGRDRFRMGRNLLSAHPQIDILVCDDGLQHLALSRDVEIVLFDERGGGNGWMLPAGPLREPMHAPPGPGCLQSSIVLYNCERPSTRLPGFLSKRTLLAPQPLAVWWGKQNTPHAQSESMSFTNSSPENCWAVAGIAQPQRFFDGLNAMGLAFTPCPRPDHDPLIPLPWPKGLKHVIITEKDAIKITPERLAAERPGSKVWVVPLILQPESGFWSTIDKQLARLTTDAPTEPATEPAHGYTID